MGLETLTLSTIIKGIGTAVSVIGAISGANEAAATGEAAQREANLQAQIEREKADSERAQAAIDAGQFEREESAKQGRQRALRAGSGIVPTAGSSLLVDQDISAEIARNRALIIAGGDINAIRLNQSASLLDFKGANLAAAGRSKRATGLIGAGATALTGGAKLFNNLGGK